MRFSYNDRTGFRIPFSAAVEKGLGVEANPRLPFSAAVEQGLGLRRILFLPRHQRPRFGQTNIIEFGIRFFGQADDVQTSFGERGDGFAQRPATL